MPVRSSGRINKGVSPKKVGFLSEERSSEEDFASHPNISLELKDGGKICIDFVGTRPRYGGINSFTNISAVNLLGNQ